MMNEKDIKDLIIYIEEGQKRIDGAKRKLISQTSDFELWVKYGIDKIDYPFLLGVDNPIRKFLDKHCSWIFNEWKYQIIELNWILEAMNELSSNGDMTEIEVEKLKNALVKSNYGSMQLNW